VNPRVAIIILNWNGWGDTLECLESVYQITYPNYDVIVVDNDSKNESVQKIREYCEGEIEVESKFFEYSGENKPIKIIEYTREEAEAGGGNEEEIVDLPSNGKMIIIKNEKNYGFAEGNNIAMRYALNALDPDYVLLLNNDTVVDKDFLGGLVKVAESDGKVGIVGPKIYYYDRDGRSDVIWFAGAGLNKWSGKTWHNGINTVDCKLYDEIKECGYITGCSMLVRSEVLHQLGGFDQIFFAYYEDTDLSVRANENGYKNIYVPKSKVWHKVSRSAGEASKIPSPTTVYYMTRNRIIFVKKHNSRLRYLLFIFYFLTYRHARRFVNFLILNRDMRLLKSFYRGVMDGLFMKS